MSDHNPGLRPWRDIARRTSRQIMVGNVPVGGGAPITVQTMTNTLTSDAVATIDQIRRCEEAGADIIMLDELSLDEMRQAVALTQGQAKLEASGGVNENTLRAIAETGVDYVSIGTLTKDVRAVDLSMRVL